MQIHTCMKRNVISVTEDTTLAEAARLFVSKHIGALPVVNAENRLIGVIWLADMLQLFMPDFVNLISNFDFVHDFGEWETVQIAPAMRSQPVSEIMSEPVVAEETAGVLRAYAMLLKHEIHDLMVVNAQGELVGIASRVDVGTAFLSTWGTAPLTPPQDSAT